MSQAVTKDPAANLASAASEAGLDSMVLLSPEAFTYATGVRIPSHTLMRWRSTAAVVTPAGVAATFTVDMEESTLANQLPDVEVRSWAEFRDDPMEVLAKLLMDLHGAGRTRIGIETDFVPVKAMRRLESLLPDVEWVACEDLVARCRSEKTPQELETIRWLSKASDDALADALDATRREDSENEIGARIITSLYDAGISEHRVLIVASGERSQYPNVGPTDRRLQACDVVRVEVFATAEGYQAGVARTAVVDEPAPKIAALWTHLRAARTAGLDVLRPGVDPRSVYRAYVDNLGPLRDRAIAFFGHGMGLDLHEPPFLSATSDDTVYEGSVLGIEPFAMLPDLRCGLQVKDVVVVTATGHQVLSDRLEGGELHVIG
jgi:Xaa-Pro aminopeptidase